MGQKLKILANSSESQIKGIINFEDWSKLDLRVGKILKVEDIELKTESSATSSINSQSKVADKLYKLIVDVGKEKRTICAGIKEYYSKEELHGKRIIVFTNLAPRKMRGIESQGMLLAAVSEDHSKVVLISPEKDIELGSRVS